MEYKANRLYKTNDMVKIACDDCKGCSACCQGMGDSIKLNPYDVYRISKLFGCSFEALLTKYVELQVEDGVILPNMKMQETTNACGFLNEEGRCEIHTIRPGLCRLFPLGRQYESDELYYFVLEDACEKNNKSKVKISKWIGEKQIVQYENFLKNWHALTKNLKELIMCKNSEEAKNMNMKFLQMFYLTPYEEGLDFYAQFQVRYQEMKQELERFANL